MEHVRKAFVLRRHGLERGRVWDMRNVRRADKEGLLDWTLYELFDLPVAARRLDFVLYDRPGVARVKACVQRNCGESWPTVCVNEDGCSPVEIQGPEFDGFLKPLVGRTVYIGVWYDG